MPERALFSLFAEYNAWMNDKIYAAAAGLSSEQLTQDRGAFFGSLMGTLNHIVAGDTFWLKRFAEHPAAFPALQPLQALPVPTGLAATFSNDLASLHAHRRMLDAAIIEWVKELTDQDLEHVLQYRSSKGFGFNKPVGPLMLHFFNHQTHHRGQVTTLLTQAGIDVGATDLLMLVPELE